MIAKILPADSTINIADFSEQLLGCKVLETVQIIGGKNSRVYKLQCADGNAYILKLYPPSTMLDTRDRLTVEFRSLEFLNRHKFHSIPRPIVMCAKERCAIYEYIEGVSIRSDEIQETDLWQATTFLAHLRDVSLDLSDTSFSWASEAGSSLLEICGSITSRLMKLLALPRESEEICDLHGFLRNDFLKAYHLYAVKCRRQFLRGNTRECVRLLPRNQRTLSPSDFGFHNAIRQKNKNVVFVDFEYFGWDDPAKVISDFILHPAMNLSDDFRTIFVSRMLDVFRNDRDLSRRLRLVYPLFGLKWCLILLNEFLHEHRQRREFSYARQCPIKMVLRHQLDKARMMLKKVVGTNEVMSCVH